MGTPGSSVGGARSRGCRRTACGVLWLLWTVLFALAVVGSVFTGDLRGFLYLAVGILTGWYDYRIWSGKAKYLWFIIPI